MIHHLVSLSGVATLHGILSILSQGDPTIGNLTISTGFENAWKSNPQNKALHRAATPLRFIAAGELCVSRTSYLVDNVQCLSGNIWYLTF